MNKKISSIKKKEETTIVGGTEINKNQVAYIIPIAMILVGLFFGILGFKGGWWVFGIGLFLTIIIALAQNVKKK